MTKSAADKRLWNVLAYCGIALLNLLLTLLAISITAGTIAGFRPGEPFTPYAAQFTAIIAVASPALTAWLAQNRPRVGSEELAEDVKALQKDGKHRSELTVVTKEDAEILKTEAARIREFQQRLEEKRTAKAAGRG